MDDDRFERLLRGYRLPDVSRDLDRRVLLDADAALERVRARGLMQDAGWSLLTLLGFGYLNWLIDLVTATDAEYDVVVI